MSSALIRDLGNGLRELLYPSLCASCGTVAPGNPGHFCFACASELTIDAHPTCPRCSSGVGEFADVEKGCPRCRDDRFQFERSFRLNEYDGPLRDLILRMKSESGEMLAECLGRLWAEKAETRFRDAKPDVVIPIPLHWWRRWQRGFNQSESLSEAIAAKLGLPHQPRWLRRIRNTPHQTELSPTQRRENTKKAFRVSRSAVLKGKSVLLIDDVLTTGSTASEAARALREGGAARVVIAVLAHR